LIGPAARAQEAKPDRLDRRLNELHCKLEELPDQKSPDGRPVVRLQLISYGYLPDKEDQLDYVLRHNVVRSVSLHIDDPELFQRLLARLPDLEEVRLGKFSWITPDLLKQLDKVKKLRSLSFNLRRFGGPELDAAAEEKVKRDSLAYLGTMKQLRALDLSDRNDGVMTDADLKPLAGLTDLEELDLTGNGMVSDEGLKVVAQMTSLRKLRLIRVGFSDESLAGLTALSKLEQLHLGVLRPEQEKWLKKQGLPLPKLTGKAVHCLEHFPEMRDLELHIIPTDPDAGLSFLRKMPKLESLVLSAVEVTFVGDVAAARKKKEEKPEDYAPDQAFSDFSEFKDLKELRKLHLHVVFNETEALEKLPTLDKLEDLMLFGGVAMAELPLLAKKAPNLRSLRFVAGFINDDDLPLLYDFKHLKYLFINDTFYDTRLGKISLRGLAAFKKARPEVTIERPWADMGGASVEEYNEMLSKRAKALDKDK
jgi:hypothetical protein